MKVITALLAMLVLTTPAVAVAQPQDAMQSSGWYEGQKSSQSLSGWSGESAGIWTGEARAAIVLARAVVRGPRGRAVIVGPRGRVRTFAYRGRRLDIVRQPAFRYPRGLGYRRWRAGELFPLALVAAPFFFLEYQALGLQPPPPGYRWVRYGPDVVLINVRTREVEDVAYGAIEEGGD
jgi:Ni/Co efflux regulator RcnB